MSSTIQHLLTNVCLCECSIYMHLHIFYTNAIRTRTFKGTLHLPVASWEIYGHIMLIKWLFHDLLILPFHFSDSEIEYADNEYDDNRGCVCVILWTCSISFCFCSAIPNSDYYSSDKRRTKQLNGLNFILLIMCGKGATSGWRFDFDSLWCCLISFLQDYFTRILYSR